MAVVVVSVFLLHRSLEQDYGMMRRFVAVSLQLAAVMSVLLLL